MLCMFWRPLLRIAIGGVVCALLVLATGWLVQRTGAFSAPFFVTAAVGVVGALVFLKFGSGRRQID